jgi:hypothetical protein
VFSVFSESRQWSVIEISRSYAESKPIFTVKTRNGGDRIDILTVNLVP